MNILIPLGGEGVRFRNEDYKSPKALVRVLGKEIIFWATDALRTGPDDTVFIAYNPSLSPYEFAYRVETHFAARGVPVHLIQLPGATRGAAETVLKAIEAMPAERLEQPLLLVDGDMVFHDDIVAQAREAAQNCVFWFADADSPPIYNYVRLDGDRVVEIAEKSKISDHAGAGAYGFRTTRLARETIAATIAAGTMTKGEFYTSDVFRTLLEAGEPVLGREVRDFDCLGTPAHVRVFAASHTCEIKRFCFDLDNTLVTRPMVKGDYTTCRPIPRMIALLRRLKTQGHTIVIATARRMRTHGGNVAAVVADIGRLTLDQLAQFDIPYDEIHFGKPYAHFYIDDLAVNPYHDAEKELGFYNTEIEPRKHNTLSLAGDVVEKRSQADSFRGEVFYYRHLPAEVADLFPGVIEAGPDCLKIERIRGIPMSYLFVNGTLREADLLRFFDALDRLHAVPNGDDIDLYANYAAKVAERFAAYDYSRFPGSDALAERLLVALRAYQEGGRGRQATIHGDPVFTNVLVTAQGQIKLIDMRGKVGDALTLGGDLFYDYAKVYQSVIGYDFVLNGLPPNRATIDAARRVFERLFTERFGAERLADLKVLTASLLFSLIPLHDSENCQDFYALIDGLL